MRLAICAGLLAFCGLTYEFVFAQSLSVLLGNSIQQYSLTIGIFLGAMGLGALRAPEDGDLPKLLWRLQIGLSLGAPSAFFSLWLLAGSLPRAAIMGLAWSMVATLGFLTGMEIPLLMKIGNSSLRLKILGFDYLGMLVASVLFPLLLLPYLGVFATVLLTASLNALAAQLILVPRSVTVRFALLLIPLLWLAVFSYETLILEWLSQRWIGQSL